MKPIPNLATPETPAAFIFGYMYANPSQDAIIKKYWPEGSSAALDPVGPSPLLIHRDQLAKVHKRWLDFSMGLRSNGDAERVIQGWVQTHPNPAPSPGPSPNPNPNPDPSPNPNSDPNPDQVGAGDVGLLHRGGEPRHQAQAGGRLPGGAYPG